jgi:hypothetical protein
MTYLLDKVTRFIRRWLVARTKAEAGWKRKKLHRSYKLMSSPPRHVMARTKGEARWKFKKLLDLPEDMRLRTKIRVA